jgi:hypothetical protein
MFVDSPDLQSAGALEGAMGTALLVGRVKANIACAGQHMPGPSSLKQRSKQRFADRRKILRGRQLELFVQSVDGVGWWAWAVVFFGGEKN